MMLFRPLAVIADKAFPERFDYDEKERERLSFLLSPDACYYRNQIEKALEPLTLALLTKGPQTVYAEIESKSSTFCSDLIWMTVIKQFEIEMREQCIDATFKGITHTSLPFCYLAHFRLSMQPLPKQYDDFAEVFAHLVPYCLERFAKEQFRLCRVDGYLYQEENSVWVRKMSILDYFRQSDMFDMSTNLRMWTLTIAPKVKDRLAEHIRVTPYNDLPLIVPNVQS